MRRWLPWLVLVLSAGWLIERTATASAPGPLDPATTGGVEVVDRALARLGTHRRLLVVGAHPDDEDTSLLVLVGRGMGGEAAYLSLSRGEGGQNLIGPELGLGLGLLRTGELISARKIEGTRQFFTRAYDFGYTRSLAETVERWPKQVLLEDAVRAIRRFRPQVVVAVFPADERAGHGQHQAAGVIAEEAFEAAGLPDRYPALTGEGLPPWQPEALYRRVWWGGEPADLTFDVGVVDPLTGRSMLQIAAVSRSMHRSQDMGTLQVLGSRRGELIRVAARTGLDGAEIFAGIDTDLEAIADLAPSEELRLRLRESLQELSVLSKRIRSSLAPVELGAAVPELATIVRLLRSVEAEMASVAGGQATEVLTGLLDEKRQAAATALMSAAGVAIEAVADREAVTPGESMAVTLTVWNSASHAVAVTGTELALAPGWHGGEVERLSPEKGSGLEQWRAQLEVTEAAAPTVPYFLRQPLQGALYAWETADPADRGTPLGAAPVVAVFDLEIEGAPLRVEREVVFQYRDQAFGEVRRPLRVLPRVEVAIRPEMILWPVDRTRTTQVEVLVSIHRRGTVEGVVELESNQRWPAPRQQRFAIDGPGAEVVRFELEPPPSGFLDRAELKASVTSTDGRTWASSYPVIDYPHIRPVTMPRSARLELQTLDLQLPNVVRVGYVRGASDRVPEVLEEVGLPVEVLSVEELQAVDLAAYDAIVIGSRAYETEPSLARLNPRLLQYVRRGGRLLVQYQQYQFAEAGLAPATLRIDRPHGRVTDESAPVRILRPGHPVFEAPNRITESDWHGWVQERGLYLAAEWGPEFLPLLEMHDEGRPVEEGSLLMAKIGEGTYIYTGLSFFRQLPAGVPGAIRLFVNLLAGESS